MICCSIFVLHPLQCFVFAWHMHQQVVPQYKQEPQHYTYAPERIVRRHAEVSLGMQRCPSALHQCNSGKCCKKGHPRKMGRGLGEYKINGIPAALDTR